MAQFAYNSVKSESTQILPFFANYGFKPHAHHTIVPDKEKAQKGIVDAEKIKGLQQQLTLDLEFLQDKIKKYANERRADAPELKEGDKVYLLQQNIKTKRPLEKLDHTKLGPFKIQEQILSINYKLSLPQGIRIHPVFHISLLEPALANAKLSKNKEVEPNQGKYKVEKILDSRKTGQRIEYLTKWKGYDDSKNTWEPTKHLKNCQKLVKQFHRQNLDLPRKMEAGH